jgi:hypothetical protein
MTTQAKHRTFIRALLCGLSVVVQDFAPSDAKLIRQSGLINLLSKAALSPHIEIRSLSLKWTEIIFHRCCNSIETFSKADEEIEAVSSVECKEASDALLPSLLQTFQSKISSVAERNIPPTPARSESKRLHYILNQTILCSPTESGFVSPHQVVPVNHSLGLWVWRPLGISDGVLFTKGGPIKDINNIEPWSR